MPIYTIKDKNTDEVFEIECSISERAQILADNPHYEQQIVKAPLYGDPYRVMGVHRPDEGFRDVLREIKKKHYKNTINVR